MSNTQPSDTYDSQWHDDVWGPFTERIVRDGQLIDLAENHAAELGWDADVVEGIIETYCDRWVDDSKDDIAGDLTVDVPNCIYWASGEIEDAAREALTDNLGVEEVMEHFDVCCDAGSIRENCRIDGFEEGLSQWFFEDARPSKKLFKTLLELYPESKEVPNG